MTSFDDLKKNVNNHVLHDLLDHVSPGAHHIQVSDITPDSHCSIERAYLAHVESDLSGDVSFRDCFGVLYDDGTVEYVVPGERCELLSGRWFAEHNVDAPVTLVEGVDFSDYYALCYAISDEFHGENFMDVEFDLTATDGVLLTFGICYDNTLDAANSVSFNFFKDGHIERDTGDIYEIARQFMYYRHGIHYVPQDLLDCGLHQFVLDSHGCINTVIGASGIIAACSYVVEMLDASFDKAIAEFNSYLGAAGICGADTKYNELISMSIYGAQTKLALNDGTHLNVDVTLAYGGAVEIIREVGENGYSIVVARRLLSHLVGSVSLVMVVDRDYTPLDAVCIGCATVEDALKHGEQMACGLDIETTWQGYWDDYYERCY